MIKPDFSNKAVLFILAVVLVCLAAPMGKAQAQDGLAAMFSPMMGLARPQLELSFRHYGRAEVGGSGEKMGWSDAGLRASAPLMQDQSREWTAEFGYSARLLDHQPNLPLTGTAMPETLHKLKLGTGYRQRLDNGWTAGGRLEVGSASDKLFESGEVTTYSLTGFVRIPHGKTNAWLVLLNFTNFRSFLPHFPLPMVAYWYQPDRTFMALIGLPMMINYMPNPTWRFSAFYLPIRSGGIKVDYNVNPEWTLHAAFRSSQDIWQLAERDDPDRQLFYYDFKLLAGLSWQPCKTASLNLTAGYAFDRFYFEGHDYFDFHDQPLRLDNTWLVNFKVSLRF